MRRYLLLICLAVIALSACEGARNNTSWSKKEADKKIIPPLTADQPVTHEAAQPDSAASDSSAASSETKR